MNTQPIDEPFNNRQSYLNPENKIYQICRISTGISLMLIGFVLLIGHIHNAVVMHGLLTVHAERLGISWSYGQLVVLYHLGPIVSMIAFLGGLLVILKRPWGWTLGITAAVYHLITQAFLLFNLFTTARPIDEDIFYTSTVLIVLFFIMAVLCTVFLGIKKVRQSFAVDKWSFGVAGTVLILLLVDKFLFSS